MARSSYKVASLDAEIGNDELVSVQEALWKVRVKWKDIGLCIGVEKSEINAIAKRYNEDPGDCLREVLSFRLAQTQALTWADIDKSLRSRIISEPRIADEIVVKCSKPSSTSPEYMSEKEDKVRYHSQQLPTEEGSSAVVSKSQHSEFDWSNYSKPIFHVGMGRKRRAEKRGKLELEESSGSSSNVSGSIDECEDSSLKPPLSKCGKLSLIEAERKGDVKVKDKSLSASPVDVSQHELGDQGASVLSRGGDVIAKEAAQLEDHFVVVVTHIKCHLIEKEANSEQFLGRFKTTLTTLPLSQRHKHLFFLREKKPQIKEASDVDEIFDILQPYLNYVDYNFLEHIVKEFGESALQKEMEEYISEMETFEKETSIKEYNEAINKDDNFPPYFAKITLKLELNPASTSLYEARCLKNNIVARSSLYGFALYMKALPSSVLITIAFPPEVLDDVRAVFTDTFIAEHRIVFIGISVHPGSGVLEEKQEPPMAEAENEISYPIATEKSALPLNVKNKRELEALHMHPDIEIAKDYLVVLFEALYSIRDKYRCLGLQIGVKESEIAKVRETHRDPGECLLNILSISLEQRPSLNLASIDEALRSSDVNEPLLASEIYANLVRSLRAGVSLAKEEQKQEMSREVKQENDSHYGTKNESEEGASTITSTLFGNESLSEVTQCPEPSRRVKEDECSISDLYCGSENADDEISSDDSSSTTIHDVLLEGITKEERIKDTTNRKAKEIKRKTRHTSALKDVDVSVSSKSAKQIKIDRWRSMSSSPVKVHDQQSTQRRQVIQRIGLEEQMGSSETDISLSPQQSLSKDDKRVNKIFCTFFRRLCATITDPISIAAKLQERQLLSTATLQSIILSPESMQSKIIILVEDLQRKIVMEPDLIYSVIEVFLQNNNLHSLGREMCDKLGQVCPEKTSLLIGSKIPDIPPLSAKVMLDDDSENEDPFGPKSPPLTDQIASVLRRYPDGGQILKELIQNADDAGASEVRFLLDARHHPTDDIYDIGLEPYQGPALYAWNDAVFSPDDWRFLGKIEQTGKKKQALKVGRFGLGFLSVFHITDLPMVISRKYIGITDPHKVLEVVRDKGDSGAGKRIKLKEFMKHKCHANCFENVFGINPESDDYHATLFRFSLRKSDSDSKISKNCYTPEKVRKNLFASLQEEAPVLLLFLRKVKKVSMYEWNEAMQKPEPVFEMEIKGNISQNREICMKYASNYDQSSSQTKVIISSVTSCIHNRVNDEHKVHEWLLMNAIGSDIKELRDRAEKNSVLPWVGIAAPAPAGFNFSTTEFSIDINDDSTWDFSTLKSQGEVCGLGECESTTGQAFCFLPLPGSISLPVNLHGYFAVSDNRRSIKWPSHDEKGDEAKWNELLLQKLVSPLYAFMLVCRNSAVLYNGYSSDAYAVWPVYAEVKNHQIWSNILDPVLNKLIKLPILWAETMNGWMWVSLEEAHFVDSVCKPPAIALKKLAERGYKVVQLPRAILETMNSNEVMRKQISKATITACLLRNALKHEQGILSSDTKEDVYDLLRYILRDSPDFDSLRDIEVIPLNEPSRFVTINGRQDIFVFSNEQDEALNFLHGVSSVIVDVSMPRDLVCQLEIIVQFEESCLKLATTYIICSQLLSLSNKSWCTEFDCSQQCIWQPGAHCHPPLEWLKQVWKWIQAHEVLDDICNIPLVPTEIVSSSTSQVKLVSLSNHDLCTLNDDRVPNSISRNILPVVQKLGLQYIPKTKIVFKTPGIDQWIKPIDSHLLLENIKVFAFDGLMLSDVEKDCLRQYLACDLLTSEMSKQEVKKLRSLPIFMAGVGGSPKHRISLVRGNCVLPPADMSFSNDIRYPSNILCPEDSKVTALLEKLGVQRTNSIDRFCSDVILPYVTQSEQSENNECLVMWVLQCPLSDPRFLDNYSIIKPCCGHSPKRPSEIYDPDDDIFCNLFDRATDDAFPHDSYKQVLHVLQQAGLKTWSQIRRNHQNMIQFFTERANSIQYLSKPDGFTRSKHLMKLLLQHNLTSTVSHIPFMFAEQTPPDDYPSNLKWYGNLCQSALAPSSMCATMSKAFEVGSVVPIASTEYCLHVEHNEFHAITAAEITSQFKQVVLCKSSHHGNDLERLHAFVMKMYDSVLNSVKYIPDFQERWIWWKAKNTFLKSDQCVFRLPPDIVSLEPFLFSLSVDMNLHRHVKALLPILNDTVTETLTAKQAIAVLNKMNESENMDVKMALDILNWLKSTKQDVPGDILIPTSHNTLAIASSCTYDDRNWNDKVKISKFTFVHEDVPPAMARHFKIPPLSQKVAPSIKLKYTKKGQKEPLTRRIKRIVDDYATKQDIFKELLQNADDATATEVKFLIDWRSHPTSSLFTEAVSDWQGPALIAFNNSVFSDADLDHICELAGETKMKDPLKTGRFGVGFCALYRLTDLPSFISRKYFTMFDPHTTYLGERVSAGEPGMRVDLVDNKNDLSFYEDQFLPYNNLFGCNVFKLIRDGYKGTLFRFPFRTDKTARESEICGDVYDHSKVDHLIEAFRDQASHLLLFLKHVQKVSIYVLRNGIDPVKDMKCIMEMNKSCECNPSCNRLSLLSQDSTIQPPSSCRSEVIYTNKSMDKVKTNWLVCSTLSKSIAQKKDRGLIPFAEVAVQVTTDHNGKLRPKHVEGYTFCFLPLPLKTGLPFHINGFFEIHHDRSSLKSVDDGRFGKNWNNSLYRDPLMHSCISALSELAKLSPLTSLTSEEEKDKYLKSYYGLIKGLDKAELQCLCESLQKELPNSSHRIIWSDVRDGEWLKPGDVIILDSFEMSKSSITIMLHINLKVCVLPTHMNKLIIPSLRKSSSKCVYNRQDFYTEIMLPSIGFIPSDLRDEHIIFLLENIKRYKWIEDLLKKYKFVPVKGPNDVLVKASDLVNERRRHMNILYDTSEGRFPGDFLQQQSICMFHLEKVGMPTKLPINEIKKRAESVANISDTEKANERCWTLVLYVQENHNLKLHSVVSDIPFLPVAQRPPNCQIPWIVSETFIAPNKLYMPKWNKLCFSLCSVVEPPEEYDLRSTTLSRIGVSEEPPLDTVLTHFVNLSEIPSSCFDLNTASFLSEATKEIYHFLNSKLQRYYPAGALADIKDKIVSTLHTKAFIWQDKHFLKATQVVMKWSKDFHPYLCSLSSENCHFKYLFSLLGVKNAPSVDSLVSILQEIAGVPMSDDTILTAEAQLNKANPISEELIEFIEEIVKQLSLMISIDKCPNNIYLPDESCVMRPAKYLACDKISGESDAWIENLTLFTSKMSGGNLFFVHPSIPRERAIKLGANPLLDSLLKGIEDENFMAGEDYGQHEDLCDRLQSILRKYPADYSILNEFLQNADDAGATEISFILDHRKFPQKRLFPSKHEEWKKLQETPALLVVNNSIFTEHDIQGISKLGRGGKRESDDTIGRFGIGFNVAYHVTDCPSFMTYSEEGEPENLCAFDPTCSFTNSNKQNPGKRWKINQKFVDDLPDQFKPYDVRGIEILSEFTNQHVVFRLPLTRMQRSYQQRRLSHHSFTTDRVVGLFNDMNSFSSEALLFLNHVQRLSAIEITAGGQVIQHFSTHLTMSPEAKASCVKFASDSKRKVQGMLINEAKIFHNKTTDESDEPQEWLICRNYAPFVTVDQSESEDNSIERNMRPIGGIAAAVGEKDTKGRLFCFLPMPLESGLPVHINGHFLVDDSRKHLEKHGNEKFNWNETLAKNVIAPCYVELITHVQKIAERGEVEVDWFYNLFPTLHIRGEASNLQVPQHLYRILYSRNPPILLQRNSATDKDKWLSICGQNKGFFCRPYVSGKKCVTPNPKLQCALLKLRINILTEEVPLTLHDNIQGANKEYEATLKPEIIVDHIKRSRTHLELLEETLPLDILLLLLSFIIDSNGTQYLKEVLRKVPLLMSADNHLRSVQEIFQSKHAKLLPHCAFRFVHKKLEESEVGKWLKVEVGVVVDLPVKFVKENIRLPDTNTPISIEVSSDTYQLVQKLWSYVNSHYTTTSIKEVIVEHFKYKPLIPASDGNLYPASHGAIVLSSSSCSRIKSALTKLGYPTVKFNVFNFSPTMYHDVIVNACSTGNDIIPCFRTKPPPNLNVDLTEREVRCIIDSVQDQSDLNNIKWILRQLKIFKTVGGAFMSMNNNPRVFIMPQDIPRDSIELLQAKCKNEFVVLEATDSSTVKFYKVILEGIADDKVDFYRVVVVPYMHLLPVKFIQTHIRHIFGDNELKHALQYDLKQKKIVELPSGEFCCIGELCNPDIPFFTTFCGNRLLPDSWMSLQKNFLSQFNELGFHAEVTNKEFIKHSQLFVEKEPSLCYIKVVSDSAVLVETMLSMIQNQKLYQDDLEIISAIPFIHGSGKIQLVDVIKASFGSAVVDVPRGLFCFKGSVLYKESNLSGLIRPVLPSSCDIKPNSEICRTLRIESPVTGQTIVCNLQQISDHYTCIKASVSQYESVKWMKKTLFEHFKELEKALDSNNIDCDCLKDTLCVPVDTSRSSELVLVKPSQLIVKIPSDVNFEPMFYEAPYDIAGCEKLLSALGIPQEITADHCIQVLQKNYELLQKTKKTLSSNNDVKKLVLSSYHQLVCTLRKDESACLPTEDVFLPSEDDELLPRCDVVFNDAPWYAERLRNLNFKYLKLPSSNSDGEKIPPKSLEVKYLTTLVREEVDESMKSIDWTCTDELLHSRESKPRCQFVQNILESLKSDELRTGLLRLYHHERKERPPKEFEDIISQLCHVTVSCVTSSGVRTVLKKDNDVIEGSLRHDTLCLADSEINQIYIAPHGKSWSEIDFLGHLSKALCVLIHGKIKNEASLMIIMKCAPGDIKTELDKIEITSYDPDSIKETKYLQPGDEMSFESLSLLDCLLILNFNIGEIVGYFDQEKEALTAAIIVGINESEEKETISYTISTGKTKQDVTGEADESLSLQIIISNVSAASLFKSLTPSQEILLVSDTAESADVRATAEPVQLFSLQEVSEGSLKELLRYQMFQGIPQDIAVTRLIAHVSYLHYDQRELLKSKNMLQFLCKLHWFLTDEHKQRSLHQHIHEIARNLQIPSSTIPRAEDDGGFDDGVSFEGFAHIPMDFNIPYLQQRRKGRGRASQPTTSISSGSYSSYQQPQQFQRQQRSQPRFQQRNRRSRQQQSSQRTMRYSPLQSQSAASPLPPVSECKAKIWLNQAIMDFKAALLMMGSNLSSPVVVQPSEQCVAHTTPTPERSIQRGVSEVECEETTSLSLESHSGSDISSLNPQVDEEKSDGSNGSGILMSSDVVYMKTSTMQPESADAEILIIPQGATAVLAEETPPIPHQNKQVTAPFPAVACSLCHEAVEKSMKGVMFAYCGVSPNIINCNGLVTILEEMKASSHFPKDLIRPIEKCVMQVNEHQNKSRYPNFQIPPCAPAVVYTTGDAREALTATNELLVNLKRCLPKGIDEISQPNLPLMLTQREGNNDYPPNWEPHNENEEFRKFPLSQESDEFMGIEDTILATLPNADIKQIWRLQNRVLWRKYTDKSKEMCEFGGGAINEKLLFHGSSKHKPEEIYKGDASFDMRSSRKGMWGCGSYFAVNASYSDGYSYHEQGVKKLLAAFVLTGRSFECKPDPTLRQPPVLPTSGEGNVSRRYDSVNGSTGGSKVYITYDNPLAYPAYLIVYTRE